MKDELLQLQAQRNKGIITEDEFLNKVIFLVTSNIPDNQIIIDIADSLASIEFNTYKLVRNIILDSEIAVAGLARTTNDWIDSL